MYFPSILKKILSAILFIGVVILALRAALFSPEVWLEPLANDLFLGAATDVVQHPQIEKTYYVSERIGRVYSFQEGSIKKKLVLDISSKVNSVNPRQGLLSLTIDPLHPQFIYLFYTGVISRFNIESSGFIDPESEFVILSLDGAQPSTGELQFGKDGMLWISLSDAGFAKDKRWWQLDTAMQGSILRIDVRNGNKSEKYKIPTDNPFVANVKGIREEVWARGFGNAKRWSFMDDEQSEVIVGDAIDNETQQISLAKAGDHLGWPYIVGSTCKIEGKCNEEYRAPMTYFANGFLKSIVGGYVYKGSLLEKLKGHYIFGDSNQGIMSIPTRNNPKYIQQLNSIGFSTLFSHKLGVLTSLQGKNFNPVSFHEDVNRELIVVDAGGEIFRIVPTSWWNQIRAFLFSMFRF